MGAQAPAVEIIYWKQALGADFQDRERATVRPWPFDLPVCLLKSRAAAVPAAARI